MSSEEALRLHERHRGKIGIAAKVPVKSRADLSLVYTPGVAAVSSAIFSDKNLVYKYTIKQNSVAVVSDGSAVLGLGNIGPEAALPVMEGKCLLMKSQADIDAFPICLSVHEPDEIVAAVKAITPSFGAINLEDIAAPACFEVESRLKSELDIPVMHDDQHATAVVVLAALINAMKVTGKNKEDVKVVINGAGAAGLASAKMLLSFGVNHIVVIDSKGAIYPGRAGLNRYKKAISGVTNKNRLRGGLSDVIKNADVFVGVSKAGALTASMVKSMNDSPIILAMANPVPEIIPDEAKSAGAAVVATGRSDFPNQVNNLLAFPGIFRGALNARATEINEEMKLAAAHAIADLVKNPAAGMIMPEPLDKRLVQSVAKAVAEAAIKTNAVRVN